VPTGAVDTGRICALSIGNSSFTAPRLGGAEPRNDSVEPGARGVRSPRQPTAVLPPGRVLLENGREDEPVRATTAMARCQAVPSGTTPSWVRVVERQFLASPAGGAERWSGLAKPDRLSNLTEKLDNTSRWCRLDCLISTESLILAQDERWRRA
jgi:hypothetical protein